MVTDIELPVEDRILQVLQHLGIQKAHFAGLNAADWGGVVANHTDRIVSLTLVCPVGMSAETLGPLASRLLVFTGNQGATARAVQKSMEDVADANMTVFDNYANALWFDVITDHKDDIGSTMLDFLARVSEVEGPCAGLDPDVVSGEVAGVSYRIQGAGPPLVLLPLALARSQWEPIITQLSEKFCTITLGGAFLGHTAALEERARTGYWPMVHSFIEALQVHEGESVLDVGCGSGVYARQIAGSSQGKNPITAIDYSPHMVTEAKAIAMSAGLEGVIEFREGNAESLPFTENTFDVVYSITVMEEVDADQMLREMIRVIKPGGRIGVIVRAIDSPWVVNLPISDGLKRKIEPPGTIGGGTTKGSCADSSLYTRFHNSGLSQLIMFPQLAAFEEGPITMRWEPQVLATLSEAETAEWRNAASQAKSEGTFFIAQPFHCAVGTKLK